MVVGKSMDLIKQNSGMEIISVVQFHYPFKSISIKHRLPKEIGKNFIALNGKNTSRLYFVGRQRKANEV